MASLFLSLRLTSNILSYIKYKKILKTLAKSKKKKYNIKSIMKEKEWEQKSHS